MERKLQAHVRVLEMQLSRATEDHERTTQRYKQEIVRQSQVIQKLHMYLATQPYETQSDSGRIRSDSLISSNVISEAHSGTECCVPQDAQTPNGTELADDNVSITSAGQFQRSGDLSVTKDKTAENARSEVRNDEENDSASCIDMKKGMAATENELETKLKNLASKGSGGDDYVRHMQKLQVIIDELRN